MQVESLLQKEEAFLDWQARDAANEPRVEETPEEISLRQAKLAQEEAENLARVEALRLRILGKVADREKEAERWGVAADGSGTTKGGEDGTNDGTTTGEKSKDFASAEQEHHEKDKMRYKLMRGARRTRKF